MVLGYAAVAPSPTAATAAVQLSESTSCPTMTDSVNRLFSAAFNRSPTEAEFLSHTADYRSGTASLEQIANELVESEEFSDRYGSLDSERYVDLVYRNILRRAATDEDRQFWISSLDGGLSKGAVMTAFTESDEYIQRTNTATPLAGYLRQYPEGSHWYCGVGPRTGLAIQPLTEPTLYADYVFFNGGNAQSPAGIQTVRQDSSNLTLTNGSLPPGYTSYKWDGLFSGEGNYGSALNIAAGQNTSWIVVFYPSSLGEQRLGWQIEP